MSEGPDQKLGLGAIPGFCTKFRTKTARGSGKMPGGQKNGVGTKTARVVSIPDTEGRKNKICNASIFCVVNIDLVLFLELEIPKYPLNIKFHR